MTKAEIEKRMNESQQELDTLKKQLNEPEKETGWEKPVLGHFYWFFDNNLIKYAYTMCVPDEIRYQIGNCFTSKELAENIARYQSLDLRIRRRIAEICEPVDWSATLQNKWNISFSHTNKSLLTCCYNSVQYGTWFCDTEAHAEQIIEEFKDELIWYFTEFKDRMDG